MIKANELRIGNTLNYYTAEEFLKSKGVIWETDYGTNVVNDFDCCKMMIEFAKFKVTEALKAALDNVQINEYDEHHQHSPNVDKQSILTAYPLDLIK